MSKQPNTPENTPIHADLSSSVTVEEAKYLQDLLLKPQEADQEETVKHVTALFEKAKAVFDEDLFTEPLAYLSAARRGLRVSDLKALLGDDFDLDAFMQLTTCFGFPFVGFVDGIVFIPSAQLKSILYAQLNEADQVSFHKDIAHYLMKLEATDVVRQSEVLYHMMQAQMILESAEYFAALMDQTLVPSADLMGSCFVSGEEGEKLIEAILSTPIAGRFQLYMHFINEVFVSVAQNTNPENAEKLVRMIERLLTQAMGEKNTINDIQLLALTGLRLASILARKEDKVEDVKRYFDNSIGFIGNLLSQNPPIEAFGWHNIDAIFNMGMICVDMRQAKAAFHCYDMAFDLLDKKVATEAADSDRHLYQATWYITIARVCQRINDIDTMKLYFERGKLFMEQAIAAKTDFVANHPTDLLAEQDLMSMHNEVADLAHACGMSELAKTQYDLALAIGEHMAASYSDKLELLVAPTITFDRLGKMYAELQDIDNARTFFEKSLNIRQELEKQHPNDIRLIFDLAAAYHNMAGLYATQEDKRPAEQYLIGQIETIRKVSVAQPKNEHTILSMLDAIISLGDFYAMLEQWDKALETLNQAQEVLKPVLGMQVSEHILNRVAGVHYKTALVLTQLGNNDESHNNMKTAAELWRQLMDATKNPVYTEHFQKANEYLAN